MMLAVLGGATGALAVDTVQRCWRSMTTTKANMLVDPQTSNSVNWPLQTSVTGDEESSLTEFSATVLQ